MKSNAIHAALPEDQDQYEACDPMEQGKDHMMATGSLFWFTGNITPLNQAGGDWHSYTVTLI